MTSDSGSASGFSQIFDPGSDSGSERKTQNPSGIDSGTPDPWSPLLCTSYVQPKRLTFWIKTYITIVMSAAYLTTLFSAKLKFYVEVLKAFES